jgi:DNA-binding PadR family transcriptional regulator
MTPPRPPFDPFSTWASFCGPRVRLRGHRGRHGRHRHRVFERGDLKFMILRLLHEEPMHGYQVMQRLEEESGGFYSASPGSVYPVLQMLQDEGMVRSSEIEGKRVYELTESGRAFLHEHRERAEGVADRVSDFGDRFGGRGMGELTRSFMRLAQASFERALEAAGDAARLKDLREILDRATEDVEAVRRPRG